MATHDGLANAPAGATMSVSSMKLAEFSAYGAMVVPVGGALELTSAFSGTVTFAGATGTLKIDNSSSFSGTIAGQLAIGDVIDLTDITAGANATITYSGNNSPGTLTVSDGTHTTNISLQGNYSLANFTASSDGHGGTLVIDPPTSLINGSYLAGVNLAWNAYGADFGTGPWGYLADWNAVTSELSAFQNEGVTTVRWWVFGDGRYSPVFNPDGTTAGLNSGFLSDIDHALQIASANHVKLLLTLTDQTMFNFPVVEGGVQLGGHADIVTDPAARQSFMDNALKPLLQHIAASPYKDAVLGYDIINEPEAQIAGGYNGSDFFTGPAQLALSDVQSFVAQAANYIHTYSGGGLATVGSAMPIWTPLWMGLGLDFYQAHYYPWMDWAGPGTGLPPVSSITSDTGVHLDKPVIVGEFPTADASYGLNDTSVYSAEWYLNYIQSQGYAGALGWSLTAGDDASNWTAFAPVFSDWVHASPPPAATAGSVSINDVTISEGNSGTKVATFTVTRSGGTAAFDVNYATSDGTATVADSDYVAASNTLHFGANQNTQTISVTINGDTKVEANETFNVGLSNATNGATISDGQGVGTITNDDGAAIAGSVSINDVTISEGNSGTKVATFTVTRSGGTAAFDVNYATSDGTATVADSDYVAAFNTLHFGANQNTQTISVTINGDTKVEANETFNVGLSNATNGATIGDGQGVGTITNDDGAPPTSGQAAIWTMDGMNLTGAGTVGPNLGPSWHVKDAADFNGDGKADILWQNDSGQAAIWTMDGMNLTGMGTVGPNPGPSWHVKDAADFNGDGKADILWQNDSGQAAIWTMDGMNLTGAGTVGPNPGPSWHVKDAADFNGDGKADILWQNDSGQAAIWSMDGMNLTGMGTVGPNPGPSWHVEDAADFNGDGKADILWQNDSGQAAIWTMDGMNLTGAGTVGPNPGPSWHVKDAADFNGDGKADILWQNDSGQAAIWTMDGMNLTGVGTVGPNPGPSWHVEDAADFNGDSKADILWQWEIIA